MSMITFSNNKNTLQDNINCYRKELFNSNIYISNTGQFAVYFVFI